MAALADLAVEVHPAVRPHADEYVLSDGRRLILLAEGRVVNLVAAEGNPAAVMDTSFAVQALALAWLAGAAPGGDGTSRPARRRSGPGARRTVRHRCAGREPCPGLARHPNRRADRAAAAIPGVLAAGVLAGRRESGRCEAGRRELWRPDVSRYCLRSGRDDRRRRCRRGWCRRGWCRRGGAGAGGAGTGGAGTGGVAAGQRTWPGRARAGPRGRLPDMRSAASRLAAAG